eukprot:1152755-Pelagomonas_calceolata.AAC.4
MQDYCLLNQAKRLDLCNNPKIRGAPIVVSSEGDGSPVQQSCSNPILNQAGGKSLRRPHIVTSGKNGSPVQQSCLLNQAKTIDLCNNPKTKEPKLTAARRIISEWPALDAEQVCMRMAVRRPGRL